ncbi:MerR family DNA-binding transcriptional regulator [Bradyrhizobium sp. USDA 4350]
MPRKPLIEAMETALDIDVREKGLGDRRQEIAMRIQEAARHLNVSARVLRHYEAEGLIEPRRTPSFNYPQVLLQPWRPARCQ